MPRPKTKLSRKDKKEIEMLASLGLTQKHIASIKGVCSDTLRKYSSSEFQRGKAKGVAKLAETAYKKANAGDTTLLIFLLKTQGGFRAPAPELPEELKRLLKGGNYHEITST